MIMSNQNRNYCYRRPNNYDSTNKKWIKILSIIVIFCIFLLILVVNAYLFYSVIYLRDHVKSLQKTVDCAEEKIEILIREHFGDLYGNDFQAKIAEQLRITPDYSFKDDDDQEEISPQYSDEKNDVQNLVKRNANFEQHSVDWTDGGNDGRIFRSIPLKMGRIRPLPSVQYSGDTSKYVLGTHRNYNGNGHLKHLRNIYTDWHMDSWGNKLGMEQYFSMDNGIVTIKETGIYLIYVQVFYLDKHDLNGYGVFKNNETILQCTVFAHAPKGGDSVGEKPNTCYTSGLAHLMENDKITVRDFHVGRYSLFKTGKSFFGFIKFGDVKPGQNLIV